MPAKNWVYGAKTPDIEQQVSDAIYAAHKYRNRLCELELAKRERHYDILRKLAPAYLNAEQAVEKVESQLADVRESIQQYRVKQRTKTPKGVDHLVERVKSIKAELKELRACRKEAKLAAYTDEIVKATMDHNMQQHKAASKEAKDESGLYWGTEAIVKQACGSFASGAPPRFKRYEGEGQLAVQLQGGLACDDATRSNTLCYLDEIDGNHAKCLIRIGSEGRDPIFARVPIVFHRPLPAGRIKWAYLERRKIATHVRWSVRLTIDCERDTDRPPPGEVAIHTGWKMETSGLRVATWLGSDGRSGVLRLSASHCDDYGKIDHIRSERDVAFNEARDSLREWLKDREVPEWMAEIRPKLHTWRSPQRLAALILRWRDDRFDGDEIFHALDAWRKRDKHRWQHERRLAVRIVRRRKDIFRKFAAELGSRYGVAFVSPIDAKVLTENSQPEELERDNTVSHRHAKWAAVSDLTGCIKEKFSLRCVEVSSVDVSRQCSNCGHVNEVKRRKVQCRECGKTYDVDDNAVANTLARGEAAVKSGALLELVAAEEDKAAKQAEKLAKMQEANRAARKRKQKERELQGAEG